MSQNTTAMQRGAGGETTGATDMTTQQPEALRLAEILEGGYSLAWLYERGGYEVSAELRRQHAENETLRAGYAAARLEIESLKAQLAAAKQINAAQFGLLAASIPGSAMRAAQEGK